MKIDSLDSIPLKFFEQSLKKKKSSDTDLLKKDINIDMLNQMFHMLSKFKKWLFLKDNDWKRLGYVNKTYCLAIKSKNSLPELTSVIEVTVLSSQNESSCKVKILNAILITFKLSVQQENHSVQKVNHYIKIYPCH